jgi:dTDP-glucose 4,6-dehydratase
MQNMLITGGCGFIGTGFIRYLLAESDFKGRVVNLDCLTYAGNPNNLEDIQKQFAPRYVFVKADIRDNDALAKVFDNYAIDAICHFAAESHVDRSIVGPDSFIQTNIVGTFNLLEQARKIMDRLVLFHHISTDEVFGSLGRDGYFTETTPYKPNSPYSASKAASDHLVRAYHKTYGLPVTISNCSNNYGPYQFPEKLIPLVLLNAWEGRPLPVYGDGQNIRDWLYVMDHCQAIWRIMRQGKHGATYNVGGRTQMTNLAVVEMICDILDEIAPLAGQGPRRDLITFVKDRPGHDRRYAIDCSKLEKELAWQPAETFDSGLRKTIRWYLDHQDWVDQVRSGAYRDWIETQYGH